MQDKETKHKFSLEESLVVARALALQKHICRKLTEVDEVSRLSTFAATLETSEVVLELWMDPGIRQELDALASEIAEVFVEAASKEANESGGPAAIDTAATRH